MSGKVFLVGAGPGDAGLLTVKAKALLSKAQVVVYDRLVGADILALLPEEAEKINVGKTAGNHPVPQEQISQILVDKAKEGKDVVRLKGGDSFVFGRGGEELELLCENGIDFEVVPGITSAIAAATYAGIPVTHRDYCASVHIITGHRKKDGELSLDYDALVRLNGTLVFLMAVSNAGEIARGLLQAGMDASMPCAMVENGTRPQQRKFLFTLSEASGAVEKYGVQSPALFLVGRVCALSDRFDWFSNLPLKGRRILVTRPKNSANRLADGLRAWGADVTLLPAIRTQALPFEMPSLDGYTALIFTSAPGVQAYFKRLMEESDTRSLFGKRVFCVGRETAKALLGYGIRADYLPSVYSGEALGRELVGQGLVKPSDRLLLLRARQASRQLPGILAENGVPFDELAVYETLYEKNVAPRPDVWEYVTFTSASCVEGFVRGFPAGTDFTSVQALCIGQQTADAAKAYGMRTQVSPQATIDSMIAWIGGMSR